MNNIARQLLQDVGLRFEGIDPLGSGSATAARIVVPGADALRAWKVLRSHVVQTHLWPVLLGDSAEMGTFGDGYEIDSHKATITDTLTYANSLDALGWLRKQHELNYGFAESDPEGTQDQQRGQGDKIDWPAYPPPANGTYLSILNHRTVALVLAPTENSWEVPAYLYFGGFNDCPEPAVHVAMLHYWHQLYDAELVCLTHDVIEMAVHMPPATPEASQRLALQQYAYCPDIVTQGTESVDALALALWQAPRWFFWWD